MEIAAREDLSRMKKACANRYWNLGCEGYLGLKVRNSEGEVAKSLIWFSS